MAVIKLGLIVVGFVVSVSPTIFQGVWNGQSLLGLVMVMIGAGWVLREEMDRV